MTSDSSGNVFLPVHERFLIGSLPDGAKDRRRLLKLASASGEVLWTLEFPHNALTLPVFSPPPIRAVGDDFLTSLMPVGVGANGLSRFSGETGEVLWTLEEPPFAAQFISLFDEQMLIATGGGKPLQVMRVDLLDGSIAWSTSYDNEADFDYRTVGLVKDSGNGIYIGGSRRTSPLPWNSDNTRGFLLRVDTGNGDVGWVNRFEQNPVSPTSRVNPRIVNGAVLATQPLDLAPTGYGFALTRIDPENGSLLGSQFLYAGHPLHPHRVDDGASGILGATTDGGFITSTSRVTPGSPMQFVIAKRPILAEPDIGALRVALDMQPSSGASGLTLTYAFDVFNDGTATVNEVTTLLSLLPPLAIHLGHDCRIDDAPCASTVTPTSVEGMYSLSPGARLRLSGTLLAGTDSTRTWTISGSAYAPYETAEHDLSNNSVRAAFKDGLFSHGFE